MYLGEPSTLIVVYKDELLVNFLKKLVETKDDKDEEHTVGIVDGSVRVVSWTEKVWLEQKKAGNINNKVLFLGNVSGVEKLIPVLDVKFNEHGIKYGWAGNQAIIIADPTKLADSAKYNDFVDAVSKYNLPENLKAEKRVVEEKATQPEKGGFFNKVGDVFKKTAKTVSGGIKDVVEGNVEKTRKQQYFYGISKLYENHLKEYIER